MNKYKHNIIKLIVTFPAAIFSALLHAAALAGDFDLYVLEQTWFPGWCS